MSTFDGPFPEMPGHHDVLTLDDGTAERLLRGVLTLDDAPPAYRGVAVLIAALTAPPTAAELAGERRMVPFIARRIAESAPVTRVTTTTTRTRSPHRLRLAVLAVVAVATLLMSLASAGALPGGAQRFASEVLGEVGISVPSPDSHSDTPSGSDAGAGASDSNGKGATVSDVAHSDSTGVEHGSDVSSIASDGQSNAGDNGNRTGQVTPRPGQQKQDTTTTTEPEHVDNGNHTGQADESSAADDSDVATTVPDQQP